MNEDVKRQWVEALESGEYKQGKGQLRTSAGKYCCLGVLTKLAEDAGFYAGPWDDIPTPPAEVCIWAGLTSSNPIIFLNDVGHPLARLNDKTRTNNEFGLGSSTFSFKKIAKLIADQL